MVRRITGFGSIIVALSALAAIGLAQSGEHGEPGSRSLADRLTALRNSVETEGTAGNAAAGRPADRTPPLRTPTSRPPQQTTTPPARTSHNPFAQEPQDQPRRPRLLSALDPRNLLSIGDRDEEPSAGHSPVQNGAPSGMHRPGLQARSPRGIARDGVSDRQTPALQRTASAATSASDSPRARQFQARRSPSVRRAEDLPPAAAAAADAENQSTALGPAGSTSTTLPSLDRRLEPLERALASASGSAEADADETATDDEADDDEIDVESGSSALADAYSQAGTQDEPSIETEAEEPLPDVLADDTSVTPIEDSSHALRPAAPHTAVPHTAVPQTADPLMAVPQTADTHTAVPHAAIPHTASVADAAPGEAAADVQPTVEPARQILSSDDAPAVSWKVSGPPQVIVGREAEFTIHLRNEGDGGVARLISRIEMPASADIISAEASHGIGQRAPDEAASTVLEWRIDELAAAEEALLRLRLIPRTSQPMNMQVSVRTDPRATMAHVEVLEPKLQLAVEGPSDVLYGEARTYRVTVTNPGTGPAENVVIAFTPPGVEEHAAVRQEVGLLAPGGSQSIELEVTPQVAGELTLTAVASATGDLRDALERRVLVRKPELVVDARGPRTTYAGTVATYYFRVQNTGNAVAKDVNVLTNLPLGAEFVRAADDRNLQPQAENNSVRWDVGPLSPGEEYFIELKCIVNSAGENTLQLAAQAAQADLQDAKTIATHVVALADLKLEVTDPKGPIAVGKDAIYEVRIKNRGSNTAEQVNVVALFSEGIDPIGVEGGQHTIENGRVAFRTIEGLPAGREIVFKIRAAAKQPGTHVFRAEVLCRELETKLAAEETTRFYLDEVNPAASEFQAAVHEEVVK